MPTLRALERERPHEPEHAVLRRDVAGLERRRGQRVRGRHRDEAPVAVLAQRRPRVLREQERARQQQREEPVPLLLGELLDRRDVLEAGVRDDRVEPAEALERRVDDDAVPLARRQVGVVDVDAVHRPAVRLEPLDDARCRFRRPRPSRARPSRERAPADDARRPRVARAGREQEHDVAVAAACPARAARSSESSVSTPLMCPVSSSTSARAGSTPSASQSATCIERFMCSAQRNETSPRVEARARERAVRGPDEVAQARAVELLLHRRGILDVEERIAVVHVHAAAASRPSPAATASRP